MKILRIIARLNVGGPARHVVWLTEGLKPDGYDTLLVAGVVPPGEDDMSYVAAASGVQPFILPEMSREISAKDALTIWKLFRLMRREQPDIVHTHTAKAGTVGRVAGLMYRWLTPAALAGNSAVSFRPHLSRTRLSQLLRKAEDASVSRHRKVPGAIRHRSHCRD